MRLPKDCLQKNKGVNNAQSLFGIQKIPSDNHIRDMLDVVPPQTVFPIFTFIAETLNAVGYLDALRSYNNNLLCALDGTQYFSSKTIHCVNCSTKDHHNGSTTYSHSALTPVFVKPGHNKVISLPPEFAEGRGFYLAVVSSPRRRLRAGGQPGKGTHSLCDLCGSAVN